MIPYGRLIQWQIDPINYRPAELAMFSSGFVLRMRFLYDRGESAVTGWGLRSAQI